MNKQRNTTGTFSTGTNNFPVNPTLFQNLSRISQITAVALLTLAFAVVIQVTTASVASASEKHEPYIHASFDDDMTKYLHVAGEPMADIYENPALINEDGLWEDMPEVVVDWCWEDSDDEEVCIGYDDMSIKGTPEVQPLLCVHPEHGTLDYEDNSSSCHNHGVVIDLTPPDNDFAPDDDAPDDDHEELSLDGLYLSDLWFVVDFTSIDSFNHGFVSQRSYMFFDFGFPHYEDSYEDCFYNELIEEEVCITLG